MTKELVIQSKSLDEIELLAKNKESLLTSIPSIQPVNMSDLKRMASGYGYRIDPFTKMRTMHFGMDFCWHFDSLLGAMLVSQIEQEPPQTQPKTRFGARIHPESLQASMLIDFCWIVDGCLMDC